MNIKRFRLLGFLYIGLAGASVTTTWAAEAPYAPPVTPRANYNFNAAWKFIREDVPAAAEAKFDDTSWATVSTPHTWNDTDSYRGLIRHGGGDQGTYLGIGWYRKHFKLPAAAKGDKVILEFEGLKQAGRFFLNGHPVGKFENGITACGVDLTEFANFGDTENILAVKVDNSGKYVEEATGVGYEWMSKDFNPNFGGLNHNVVLHLMGKIYQTLPLYENLQTTGIYIHADKIDVAQRTVSVALDAQVRNETGDFASITLGAVIVDAHGVVRAKLEGSTSDLVAGQTEMLTATGTLASADFWAPDTPALYEVYTTLSVDGNIVDVCRTETGFRKTEFRGGAGTGGVYLNDKFIWLTGYAQRAVNDWAGLGQAYPDWMHDYNAALVRSTHGNYIRWMHIAPQAADVRACDRAGIVQVCPAGDKEKDAQGRQWEQRVEVMRDTIIYYRNSPSILFWEAGNQVVSAPHMEQMVALRKQWDPAGGRVMGVRHGDDNVAAKAVTPIAEYYGVMIGQAPQTDQIAGDAVFRGYSISRRDRAPLIETEDLRDEAARGIWDDYSPPHFGFKKGPEDSYAWNSETFCLEAAKRYFAYASNRIDNPDPAHSKWSGYASIYWSDSDADGRQQSSEVLRVSGKVDGVRLPKEAYYVYRVMQSTTPDLHIIGHWTYPAGTKKTMYIAANGCDTVELLLNGKSLGKNTTPTNGYIYAFPDVAFAPGSLKAVATTSGKMVASQELTTAGAAQGIRLTVHAAPAGLQADGSDVAFIDFEVIDAAGRRCPTDEARVNFAVSGPAIWRGGLNSAVINSTNNLYLNTECGINRVSIRSTLQPGTITITATREGLAPGSVTITSQPVPVSAGLLSEKL